jgi:hypothetical protein
MNRRDLIRSTTIGTTVGLTATCTDLLQAQEEGLELSSQPFFSSATAGVDGSWTGGEFLAEANKPFAIYQLSQTGEDTYEILSPLSVVPDLDGSEENPDVALGLELVGVQFGEEVWTDARAADRATIRLTTKRELGATETLHWAITTAVNLYEAYKGDKPVVHPIDLNARLIGPSQTMQFKGGAGAVQLEVLGHERPDWWQKVFNFLRGEGGQALMGAIGFPAVNRAALGFIDELTNRIKAARQKPIFSAGYAAVVFSKQGLTTYAQRNPARLSTGLWLVVNPTDKSLLEQHGAYYFGGYARMVPGSYGDPTAYLDVIAQGNEDPFRNITYAVLDADMVETKFL